MYNIDAYKIHPKRVINGVLIASFSVIRTQNSDNPVHKYMLHLQKMEKIYIFIKISVKIHVTPLPPVTMLTMTYSTCNGIIIYFVFNCVQHCYGGEGGMFLYFVFLKSVTYILHRVVGMLVLLEPTC